MSDGLEGKGSRNKTLLVLVVLLFGPRRLLRSYLIQITCFPRFWCEIYTEKIIMIIWTLEQHCAYNDHLHEKYSVDMLPRIKGQASEFVSRT